MVYKHPEKANLQELSMVWPEHRSAGGYPMHGQETPWGRASSMMEDARIVITESYSPCVSRSRRRTPPWRFMAMHGIYLKQRSDQREGLYVPGSLNLRQTAYIDSCSHAVSSHMILWSVLWITYLQPALSL